MARARTTNVAARYQGKWEQFKQKSKEEVPKAAHAPRQLTQATPSNSSSSSLLKRTSTSSNTDKGTTTATSTTINPRRVSFHGLKSKDSPASSKQPQQPHTRKLSFKTKQESQTKHPKVVKELQSSSTRKWTKPLHQQQQQQQQTHHSIVPAVPIPIPTSINRNNNNNNNSNIVIPVGRRRRPRNTTTTTTTSVPTQLTQTKLTQRRRMETSSSNNVSVVCRLRPIVPHETKRGAQKVVHKVRTIEAVLQQKKEDEEIVRVELPTSVGRKGASRHQELIKCFALDGVLEEQDTQEDVYKKSGAFKAVSQDLFRGFHCTILAYGQSGSGKTYTMGTMASEPPATNPALDSNFEVRGSDSLDPQAGVIQRACYDLFQQVEEQCMGDATVELSYLEIYNEEVRDLLSTKTSKLSHQAALRQQKERERLSLLEGVPLSPSGGGASNSGLQIREDPSGEVFVQGKTSVAVTNPEQVIELMRLANAKRVVASTKLNDVSSRSHAICILTVTGTNSYDVTFQSRLTLVDLAGSERLSKTENTGWRAKEGININAGLFVLGLVISALTETRQAHKRHPPYRESKLTRILQNSLGGNARTIMIACCSPTDYHSEESVNTLRYATQARNIENPAVANIVHDEHAEQVLQLQSENDQLAKKNMSLEEQIAEYENLIKQISSELTHVKTHYEHTTSQLQEVKQDYQTTAEQLMEIQEDFKTTVQEHKKEKIEDVLKKQTRRQKRLSSGQYLQSDDDFLVVDPHINNNTPTRSIYSAFGEHSVGTEPTADLTIGTTAVSPMANRLVPPPTLIQDDNEEEEEDVEEKEEQQEEIGEASVPTEEQPQEQQGEPETSVPHEEEQVQEHQLPEEEDPFRPTEDPSAAETEDESVPVSQVAPEECDQSQAISFLTEHQEWNENDDEEDENDNNSNNNDPLLGELQGDTDSVSISKALEQAQASQDLDDQTKELQEQLDHEQEVEEETKNEMTSTLSNSILEEHRQNLQEEGSLHSLDESLTTEIHEPLSTNNNNYVEEEKKDAEQEEGACDSSYQKCKTSSSKLYCNDSLVDKESEVMVEAVPVSMPYNDLTGVNMPSMMSPKSTTATTTGTSTPKSKLDEHSLQSGTITQGSQATSASNKQQRKSGIKGFMSKFNCISGAYGMVQNSNCARPRNQTVAQVERL